MLLVITGFFFIIILVVICVDRLSAISALEDRLKKEAEDKEI